MRIIPAIDIIDGKCVRLSGGDYTRMKVYNEDPLEVAKDFEAHGMQFLHLVDLDGAKANHIVNHKVLYRIATKTNLRIDFGGGLKKNEDLNLAFESGAQQITGGSIAVRDPETFLEWLTDYGPDKIILGADARNESVAVSGWTQDSGKPLIPFIGEYRKKGVSYVICTDISKDGMLSGPATELYRKILANEPTNEESDSLSGAETGQVPRIRLIASGGISDISELKELEEIGCEGVIIGKAIYEGRIRLKELESLVIKNGE